ncbi:MAG TPA: hypothetical protein ENO31_03580 [Thermoprotei archaeon]|nr:hypothetical protein [Thermoprotei archaeon]
MERLSDYEPQIPTGVDLAEKPVCLIALLGDKLVKGTLFKGSAIKEIGQNRFKARKALQERRT